MPGVEPGAAALAVRLNASCDSVAVVVDPTAFTIFKLTGLLFSSGLDKTIVVGLVLGLLAIEEMHA